MLTGRLPFDPLDLMQRDAGAHNMTEICMGHPDERGIYHYHQVTHCEPPLSHMHLLGKVQTDSKSITR